MPFHVSMDWTPFIARIVLKIIKFLNNPAIFPFPMNAKRCFQTSFGIFGVSFLPVECANHPRIYF